ncbi:MAG: ATP-binding protein [Ignavibacteria bacterium]|jgi:nitrogen fixation/metabolism regulation signal transduction histidine kinase|nr:ATP-binding protein [Ignavibacteria bacterium]MDH7527020.1 ATP-binding protein [Ignavibacteria bacterium]
MRSYLSRLFLKENRLQLLIISGFLLLILSALIFPYYQSYVDENWETFVEDKIENSAKTIQKYFDEKQNELIKENNFIKDKLSPILLDHSISFFKKQDEVFKILIQLKDNDFSHQIFDSSFNSFAWSDYLKILDKNLIIENLNNFQLLKENFRTYLVHGEKIADENDVFYLLSFEKLEEDYQIRNEFIQQNSLVNFFTQKLNLKVSILMDTIYFSFKTDQLSNSALSFKPIKFLNGKTAFYVSIQKPEKLIYLQKLSSDFGQIQKIIFLIILSILIYSLFKDLASIQSRLIQALAVSVLFWLYRIVLLILDFPASILEGNIVNPSIYASRFLFGLVKSPLELFITASVLSLNLIIILVLYKMHLLEQNNNQQETKFRNKILAIFPALIFVIISPAVLRGFGASFRSFVFDSTIKFFEQPSLIPDPIHLILYYSVFATGISLVLYLMFVVYIVYRSLRFLNVQDKLRTNLIILLALIIPVLIFYLSDSNPQYSILTSFLLIITVVLIAYYSLKETTIFTFRTIFLILICSSIFSSIFIYEKNEEQKKELQKTIASELLKPREKIINFALNQTLAQIGTDIELSKLFYIESGAGYNNSDFNFLAYRLWINSILSDEGLNSYLFLFDKYGKPLGSFGFGMSEPDYLSEYFEPKLVNELTIFLIKSHSPNDLFGVIPIKFKNTIVGYCGVVIRLSQENFQPTISNTLFKNIKYEKNPFNLLPDAVVYVYKNNQLELLQGDELPLTREIDAGLINNALTDNKFELWLEEQIDSKKYQTYILIYNSNQPIELITVSIPKDSFILVLFTLFKFILVHIIISLIILMIGTLILVIKGYRFILKFKTRLFIGLFFVTLIPIIILAYFTRESEMTRWKNYLSNELKKDLDILSLQLNPKTNFNELSNLSQKINLDFNIYKNYELVYSTQNKLYQIGFFPNSISASVFDGLIIENKNYTFDFEYISDYQYLVGYKKVNSENENLIISVPTLYQHEKIQRELGQIDTFIFGAYSLTLLLIFLFGNLFFEKLTRPISELTEATKKVSSGDLSVKLEPKESGEVGDLIEAFNKMISDLEESRKNLARIEREQAWKEMAKQVAHEIKNPLTPMKLSLQHLQFLYKENRKEFARIFGKVSTTLIEQIETLTKITNEFSHFARMPERKIIKCDLEEILKEVINLFSAETKVEFESVPNETFFVNADKEELKRVFINIIKNSVQANSTEIKIKLYKDANYCFINIEDNGSGIPEELLDKIFDPNFSTKTEGAGLGLPIVKRILTDINGNIEIKSEVGKGTIVMIAIPQIKSEN